MRRSRRRLSRPAGRPPSVAPRQLPQRGSICGINPPPPGEVARRAGGGRAAARAATPAGCSPPAGG
ncbi:hypothetical protein SGCZBJ_14680 [Caulobacter zeae]|uniref:Uncharacterized protein n=1 Tax=Caulobacter zeae TaxID=2055137 RepID=A0A2N5DCP0_9CAUL|nr:hypothetical protein SGCZBJ_14680 [Caulobacter zeae]